MDVRSLGYVVIESADPTKWLEYGRDILGLMPAPNMPDDGNVYLKLDAVSYTHLTLPTICSV